MIYLILILLFIFYFDCKINRQSFNSSKSEIIYNDIKDSEMKRIFLELETSLLELETLAVNNGVVMIKEATFISNRIKELFPMYDFSYHGIHLKQIAEPTKLINTGLPN